MKHLRICDVPAQALIFQGWNVRWQETLCILDHEGLDVTDLVLAKKRPIYALRDYVSGPFYLYCVYGNPLQQLPGLVLPAGIEVISMNGKSSVSMSGDLLTYSSAAALSYEICEWELLHGRRIVPIHG